MNVKRFFAVLLALILTLGTAAFAADSFSDVPEDAYYADAVAWAVEKGITEGRPGGIFDPDATVNRAEAVTFLWRATGRPEPTETGTFADVEGDANSFWYKTAVQWAVELGIIKGTAADTFSPYMTCTRGMILTMLYRLNGNPYDEALKAVVPEDPESWTMEDIGNGMTQMIVGLYRSEGLLTDVPEGEYYELPVIWAAMSGILDKNVAEYATEGAAEDETARMTVRPMAECPRGEIVYFLYRASGDAPMEGAVAVGRIPETVLLDADGVKITATGIKADGLTDAVVNLSVVNGTEKTLLVDGDRLYVNSFGLSPQLCIPRENEDGWTFYADAVIAPGETRDCELRLNSLDEMGIEQICEVELRLRLVEVEEHEFGYDYMEDFAEGETVIIRTSLYDEDAAYGLEGSALLEQDGLELFLLGAENKEYTGPEIRLYAYNGGSEDVSLELEEIKLDGKSYDGFFGMELPAGKRAVSTASVFIEDFDNIPEAEAAELTFRMTDPETGEPILTFDPVTVTFED